MAHVPYSRTDIPISYACDVLVAGGGLGGIAAAVSAARAGADTILLERNMFLGGVATAGHCCSIFNCFYTEDQRQAVNGVAFELTNRLAECAGPGLRWQKHRGHIIYDVELGKLTLHEFLSEAGVRLLLGSFLSDVLVENGTVQGAIFTGRCGLEAILCKRLVDATGDADAAYLAGAPLKTDFGRASYVFRIGGVDVDRFVDYLLAEHQYPDHIDVNWSTEEAVAQYRECGTLLFPHGGGRHLVRVQRAIAEGRLAARIGEQTHIDALQMHAIRRSGTVHIITGFFTPRSLASEELARHTLEGKRMAVSVSRFFREEMPGFENSFLCSTAEDVGIRTSRYIDGEFVYEDEMRKTPSRFADAIGKSLIVTDRKLFSENSWKAQCSGEDCCEIPLRALLPRSPAGLIMGSGRSISARSPGYMRVMVNTMVVGQGAGIAAAVSARNGTSIPSTDYADIRAELVRQHVFEE